MIRFATPEDAGTIAEIHVDTWRDAYRGLLPDTVLDSLSVASRAESWRRGIQTDPRNLLVAEPGREMAGWIAFGRCRDDDAKTDAEIYAMYVRSSSWRMGIGRTLITTAEREMWSRGFGCIRLWVLEQNSRARKFYAACGYVPDGATKDLPMGEMTLQEIRYRKERNPQPISR